MPGQQFFQQLRGWFIFALGQRDIATVDDEDHTHFIVGQIL